MKSYSRRQVPFKVIDGICYIIDSFQTKSAYKLNETSPTLWLFLSEKRTFEEIIKHFMDEYEGMTPDELQADTTKLISEMIDQSLIHDA